MCVHANPHPSEYNSFLFWRRPLDQSSCAPQSILYEAERASAGVSAGAGERAEEPKEGGEFSDFLYWRRPLPPIEFAPPLEPPAPPLALTLEHVSDEPDEVQSGRVGADEEMVTADTRREGEEGEADGADLLSGGVGLRLIGVLASLTAHPGASSRFAGAAARLQNDVLDYHRRAASSAGSAHAASEAAAPESDEGSGAEGDADGDAAVGAPDAAPRRSRTEPASASILREPQVMASMTAMLRLLESGGLGPSVAPEPLLLLGGPTSPTPASPQAVAGLLASPVNQPADPIAAAEAELPPLPAQMIGSTCSICLDALSERHETLHMPCSHTFHKDCLLRWLQNHSGSCPLCRDRLEEP